MKKIINYILCVLLFVGNLTAQNSPTKPALEGKIRYLVTHNWTKKMAAVDYISKQKRERISYMWGNRSEWKVYTNLYFSPKASKYEDSEELAEPEDEGYSWRKNIYIVTRNLENNTEMDAMDLVGKVYVVEDSIRSNPKWKILNNIKEVAGHICMNAFYEDKVKMQKITAWFALDMPLPIGPERLGGLPGIILEVDINDGGMVIMADKIELAAQKPETFAFGKKIKGKKINEAQYLDILKKFLAEKKENEEPPFWGIRY